MEELVKGAEKSKISGTFKNLGFLKGDVVVLPFPFSDLSQSKRRPALVAANLEGDDIILCQIGSLKESKIKEIEESIIELFKK